MYNSDLASDIEKAVQDALATSDFSKLNKNITTAVNTSIAQIGTSQNRFYQQYDNQETTAEDLERIDGEIVNGDMRADYKARRQAAQAEAERARYNSRQAIEARRKAAEERRRQKKRGNTEAGTGQPTAHQTGMDITVTRAIPANCARLRRHSAFLAVLPRRRQTKTAETFRKTLSGCQGRTPVIPIGQLPPTAPIPPLSWYRSAAIRKGVFPASSCQYLDGLALQPA